LTHNCQEDFPKARSCFVGKEKIGTEHINVTATAVSIIMIDVTGSLKPAEITSK
jgi:hypothetical protein